MLKVKIIAAEPGWAVITGPDGAAKSYGSWDELRKADPRINAEPVIAWGIRFVPTADGTAYSARSTPILDRSWARTVRFDEADAWVLIHPDGKIRHKGHLYLRWEDFVDEALDSLRGWFKANRTAASDDEPMKAQGDINSG